MCIPGLLSTLDISAHLLSFYLSFYTEQGKPHCRTTDIDNRTVLYSTTDILGGGWDEANKLHDIQSQLISARLLSYLLT